MTSPNCRLPPLPPDWSEHPSSSHPGHVYYYNKYTGDKTWDREQLVAMGGNKETVADRVKVVSSLGIEELEKLLEEKKRAKKSVVEKDGRVKGIKREAEREGVEQLGEKRKVDAVDPTCKKRQKIVFEVKRRDEKVFGGKEGRRKESPRKKETDGRKSVDRSREREDKKSSTSSPKHVVPLPTLNSSKDKTNISSDSSLYGMDEDELQELKKIKSKYSSPPKTPKKTIKLPPTDQLPPPPTNTSPSPKYLPENYGSQYVNYQNEPKQTYQRQFKARDRPVLARLEGQLQSSSLPLHWPAVWSGTGRLLGWSR